jgi:hypothetical protein
MTIIWEKEKEKLGLQDVNTPPNDKEVNFGFRILHSNNYEYFSYS